MTYFVNLTPHDLHLHLANHHVLTIPHDGTIARVTADRVHVADINGFPVFKQTFGDVQGLPAPAPGVTWIVSGMVLSALNGTRDDVVAPDSGAGAVRDADGKVIGTTGFVR